MEDRRFCQFVEVEFAATLVSPIQYRFFVASTTFSASRHRTSVIITKLGTSSEVSQCVIRGRHHGDVFRRATASRTHHTPFQWIDGLHHIPHSTTISSIIMQQTRKLLIPVSRPGAPSQPRPSIPLLCLIQVPSPCLPPLN